MDSGRGNTRLAQHYVMVTIEWDAASEMIYQHLRAVGALCWEGLLVFHAKPPGA